MVILGEYSNLFKLKLSRPIFLIWTTEFAFTLLFHYLRYVGGGCVSGLDSDSQKNKHGK